MTHKIAVIGLGGIAQNAHLPILTSMPGVELFLYSRTHEKVKDLAEKYRINKWTTNLDELLGWKADCAYILSPTNTHAELATIFLNENMDIFIEKPATASSQETQKIAELADQKKRIVLVAFNRRYAPLSIKAKETWGKRPVILANFQKSRTKPYFKGLYTQISEELVHTVDTLRFLCDEAKAVKTEAIIGKDNFVLGVACLLKLEQGGIAQISSCLHNGHWFENYELNGDGCTLNLHVNTELHFAQADMIQSWKEPYDSSWNPGLFGRGFVGEIQHFLHCIKTREQPQTNLWESVKTQKLVEEIYSLVEQSPD